MEASLKELGNMTETYNIPTKMELLNASISTPLEWNAINNFQKGNEQSQSSYEEQKLAINMTCTSLYNYATGYNENYFVKSNCISGAPGSGKTFCNAYTALYALSLGLNAGSTALMSKHSQQIGGLHIAQ